MFCIKLKVSKALVSNESSKTNCGTNFGREKNLWSKPQYNKFSWVFTNFFGYFNFYELKKSHILSVFIFVNRLVYKLSQVSLSENISKMSNIFAKFYLVWD